MCVLTLALPTLRLLGEGCLVRDRPEDRDGDRESGEKGPERILDLLRDGGAEWEEDPGKEERCL
jgi:hypothetical protein